MKKAFMESNHECFFVKNKKKVAIKCLQTDKNVVKYMQCIYLEKKGD
jgi:hypothetical protein